MTVVLPDVVEAPVTATDVAAVASCAVPAVTPVPDTRAKLVALVMLAILAPAGINGLETAMPAASPVVEAQFTVALLAVVATFIRRTAVFALVCVAYKVRLEADPVAGTERSKEIGPVTAATVAPEGTFAPITGIPTTRPAVESQVTLSSPLVVIAPANGTDGLKAVKVWPDAAAVAGLLSTKTLLLVIEATVAPAGIFGPVTTMPTDRPLVKLAVVVTLVPFRVVVQAGITTLAGITRMAKPVPSAVELELFVTVRFWLMEVIAAPAGMPLPTTFMPRASVVFRAAVMVELLLLVTPAVRMAEVRPIVLRVTPVALPRAR